MTSSYLGKRPKGDLMRIAKVALAVVVALVIAMIGFVYLAPQYAGRLLIDLQRSQAGLERREVQLPNGLHYVYLEGGRGAPLMLLHGFGGDKDNFDLVAKYLTLHYRVIVPDQIGFGESSHPQDADYGPVAQAARLRDLARSLNIASLHLGGNSMGGHIALTYAALYPDEVKSLWLLDTGGVWSAPKSALVETIEKTGKNPLLVRNEDDFAKLLPVVMKKPPFIPRPILNVAAKQRIKNYSVEQRIFKAIEVDSVEGRVTGLKTPALIVWGKEDQVISVETAEVLQKLMPRSKVIVMPGTGHMPMMENPKQSAEDYAKFRAELGG
jgi:pimeloyl-ACP methyl ester carboxylesterase